MVNASEVYFIIRILGTNIKGRMLFSFPTSPQNTSNFANKSILEYLPISKLEIKQCVYINENSGTV